MCVPDSRNNETTGFRGGTVPKDNRWKSKIMNVEGFKGTTTLSIQALILTMSERGFDDNKIS